MEEEHRDLQAQARAADQDLLPRQPQSRRKYEEINQDAGDSEQVRPGTHVVPC